MSDLQELIGAVKWLERLHGAKEPDVDTSDGLLHTFRVTYNVAERVLRQSIDCEKVGYLPSSEIALLAAEEGLMDSPTQWTLWGHSLCQALESRADEDARNTTQHIPAFLDMAHHLIEMLNRRKVAA